MGFEIPENTVTFVLEGYEGAEVTASLAVDIEGYFKMAEMVDRWKSTEMGISEIREIVGYFAEHVAVGWNFEKNGEPVPLTPETMLALPTPLLLTIITSWQQVAGGSVGAPLDDESDSGSTSEEE